MRVSSLGAHVPWAQIDGFLDQVLELGLVPEIAFKGPDLDQLSTAQLDRVANRLEQENLRPTVHAPFFDLNPGALDPLVQQVTQQRLQQALAAARQLRAHLMVVHPGYDRWRYPGLADAWFDQACSFFPALLQLAEQADCRLAVENIYEEDSATLVKLVTKLNSPWLGHCFDVGHWHLFGAEPMQDWLVALGERLIHLHLHDNQGTADDHSPVGCGHINFDLLFANIRQLTQPPSMTLEAHSPEDLHLSLQQVKKFLSA